MDTADSHFLNSKPCLPAGRFLILNLCILVATFAAIPFAADPAFALATAWRTLAFAGVAILIASGFLSLSSVVLTLGLAFAGQAVLAVIQFFTGGSLGLGFLGESSFGPTTLNVAKIVTDGEVLVRGMGTLAHANILGGLCAVVLILCITQCRFFVPKFLIFNLAYRQAGFKFLNNFLNSKPCLPAGRFLILNLLVAGVFFSFSRSALGASLAVLIVFLIFTWLRSRTPGVPRDTRCPIGLLVAPLLTLTILIASFWPVLTARVGEGVTAGLSRLEQVEQAITIIKDHPLGVGRGQYAGALHELRPDLPQYALQPVHNFFLLKAAEEGVLVAAAYLALLFYLFYQSFRERRFEGFMLIALLFALMQVDHYFADSYAGELVWWVVVGSLAKPAHSKISLNFFTPK